MRSLELPSLFVEGRSDLHTIIQLLHRHDIVLDRDTGPVRINDARSDTGVLQAMPTAVRASTNRPVGFVLDANGSVAGRWQSICDRLANLGLDLPDQIPAAGYIGSASATQMSVGVWIMPDNATDTGALENLVRTLVPDDDALFRHARSATNRAGELGAAFPGQAELHCWLAWQKEPGLPFGTAIKARFFRHDSLVACRFVQWFRKLYSL